MLELLTEIGDTQAGKKRILKAYTARKKQIAAADKALAKNMNHPEATEEDDWENDPDSPAGVDKVAVTRAKLQARKVDTYMRARSAGENASAGLNPKGKTKLANAAAKEGLKVHKDEYGEASRQLSLLRKFGPKPSKGKGRRSTRGSAGQGLEAARRNSELRGREQNYRNN